MAKTGIELITEERQEQIEKHGRTSKHDDQHEGGELVDAAVICAANNVVYEKNIYANSIHFDKLEMGQWQLPVAYKGNALQPNYPCSNKKRIHQLKVAGALIAAEIDRLQRINPPNKD